MLQTTKRLNKLQTDSSFSFFTMLRRNPPGKHEQAKQTKATDEISN